MPDNNAYVLFHWTVLKLKKRERERKKNTYIQKKSEIC